MRVNKNEKTWGRTRTRGHTRTRRRQKRSRGSCETGILAMLAKIAKFNAISYQVPTGCACSSFELRRTHKTNRQKTRGISRQGPRTAKNSNSSGIQFCLLLESMPMMSALWKRRRQATTRHCIEYEKKWCWKTIVKVGDGTRLYAWLSQQLDLQERTFVKFLPSYRCQFIETRKGESVNSPSKFACNFTTTIKITSCKSLSGWIILRKRITINYEGARKCACVYPCVRKIKQYISIECWEHKGSQGGFWCYSKSRVSEV